MPSSLARLFQHLEWADQTLLAVFQQAGEPPSEALKLLAHLLAAEAIWLSRIRGDPAPPLQVWPDLDLAGCRELRARTAAGYQALLPSLKEEQLDAPVAYRTSRGVACTNSLGDILLHVALHGSHHRGQIAALLRASGIEPAATDFILFARDRPGPGHA